MSPVSNRTGVSEKDSYFRTDHLKADLKIRSARGGVVTLISQGLKFIISMVATMVLARLLTPEAYGLIGMVIVVTGFVSLFKDLGLSAATIQRHEISHEQISNLFWINVALSVATMLMTMAIAPAIAWFYGDRRLIGITMVYAVGFAFGGLTIQHDALLRRQMRFITLAIIDILSLMAGPMTSIILAWRGVGYWSLVFGQLATGITNASAVWIACGWRPGRPVRYAGSRSILRFGANLTGFGVVNYFSRNLDNLLIGRFWGAQALGLYTKSFQLLLLPIEQVISPITAVAVPTLSRLTDSPERYRKAYIRILEKVAIVAMPGMAFMMTTSDWLVALLLGPQWAETARIVAFLGAAGIILPINQTSGWLFVSQGRTHHMFQWGLIAGTFMILSIIAGLPWGPAGVAFSYSVVMISILTPMLFWFVGREGPVQAKDFYYAMAPAAFAALSVGAAIIGLRHWLALKDPLVGFGLSLIVAAIVTLLALVVLPNGRLALSDTKELLFLMRYGEPLGKEPSRMD